MPYHAIPAPSAAPANAMRNASVKYCRAMRMPAAPIAVRTANSCRRSCSFDSIRPPTFTQQGAARWRRVPASGRAVPSTPHGTWSEARSARIPPPCAEGAAVRHLRRGELREQSLLVDEQVGARRGTRHIRLQAADASDPDTRQRNVQHVAAGQHVEELQRRIDARLHAGPDAVK